MAAGLRQPTELLEKLMTKEVLERRFPMGRADVISFSGGVADCIRQEMDWREFGDLGSILGKAIAGSALCRGEYRLGREPIRATVIGAGCHSAQLSGSTVFYRGISLPMKNLPTAAVEAELPTAEQIRQALSRQEGEAVVLALPGISSPRYEQVAALADAVAAGFEGRPVLVALRQDMAKALGHALALRLPGEKPVLCIDSIHLTADSYLDVGAPVGPALPVVVKTLILSN
jgi:ethanolamine utilization protein EutA